MKRFFVAGTPAPFATKGEFPWKKCLQEQIPKTDLDGKELGLYLHFVVPEPRHSRFTPDVDNLCEPVFSVLVNKKGWFGGRRPNIIYWQAQRVIGSPTGCHISVRATGRQNDNLGAPLWSGTYTGTMPKSARSPELADWAQKLRADSPPRVSPETFIISMKFGSRRLNLGDIATGKVKSVIDCLFPILGGISGAPEDHRVTTLLVEKDAEGVDESSVQVQVWDSAVGEYRRF